MDGGPLPQNHPELVEHLLDLPEVNYLEGREVRPWHHGIKAVSALVGTQDPWANL